ncbi:MAG TPA: hypothetical protein VH877_06065 [Polyangia bacterium]|nr:hypothetical protein [Polyangia bacterium]
MLPTLFVIDSTTGDAVLRWPGSATVPQLERLLEDGERATRVVQGETGIAALAQADRLAAAERYEEAAKAYRVALDVVSPSRRPRVIESLLIADLNAGAAEDCAHTALAEIPKLERGPSFANAAAFGLLCAKALPAATAWRPEALDRLAALVEEALALPNILADDRSGLYEELVMLRRERNDAAGAQELAGRWLTFVETEAARAPTAAARAAFNHYRATAAIALGDPGRALAAVKESEEELPDDYDPPYRRAVLERALGHDDLALAAFDRAAALAHGPRRVRIFEMCAEIEEKRGDRAAVRRRLADALAAAEALPPGQGGEYMAKRLRKRLAAVP